MAPLLKAGAILGLFAAVLVLLVGVGSMAGGGAEDREHSTQYMTARVVAQGIALASALLFLVATRL